MVTVVVIALMRVIRIVRIIVPVAMVVRMPRVVMLAPGALAMRIVGIIVFMAAAAVLVRMIARHRKYTRTTSINSSAPFALAASSVIDGCATCVST
jgi:hypothetical protein